MSKKFYVILAFFAMSGCAHEAVSNKTTESVRGPASAPGVACSVHSRCISELTDCQVTPGGMTGFTDSDASYKSSYVYTFVIQDNNVCVTENGQTVHTTSIENPTSSNAYIWGANQDQASSNALSSCKADQANQLAIYGGRCAQPAPGSCK